MGKRLAEITDDVRRFIEKQHVFFVGTAPITSRGHVNVSPKGLDTFRVLSPTRVAYLDLTGSGNETAAHVSENQRLTLMFCAFSGKPRILRIYCKGRVILRESAEWQGLLALFPDHVGRCGVVEYVVWVLRTRDGVRGRARHSDQVERAQGREGPDRLPTSEESRESGRIRGTADRHNRVTR